MPDSASVRWMATSSPGDHGVFVALAVIHALSALVAFGSIAMAGVYAGTARHLERPGALEEARRWFRGRNWGLVALPAVPVLGILALVADGRPVRIGEAWSVAALALWCLVAGIAWWVIRPAEATLRRLLCAPAPTEPMAGSPAPGPDGTDGGILEEAARRLSWAAGVCDVVFVVALGLMIWQPG